MESKFESAKLYLIELLRLYGHRPIIVKINQGGEEVEVMARTFVRRQLTAAEIEFPWKELNKRSPKFKNSGLDNDELSILFHRAVFDLESAYVEEFCQGKPEAEAYINSIYSWIERKKEWLDCTFSYYAGEEIVPFFEESPKEMHEPGELSEGLDVSEEDVKELKKMGFKKISSIQAMMQVFWSFASYRTPIRYAMKNAILSITVDEEAADFLESYCHFYNSFMQPKIEDGAWSADKEQVKKYENQIKELNVRIMDLKRKHQVELEERTKKHKKEITERNKKHQEELLVARGNTREYKNIIENFRINMTNPYSKISQIYDLTDEHDIRHFISWFRVLKKKVKNQTVKYIVAKRFEENPDDAELFKKMVEEYNSSLLPDGSM